MCRLDNSKFSSVNLERVMGIEPTLVAWEATVLPLNYTRIRQDSMQRLPLRQHKFSQPSVSPSLP